MNPNTPKRSRVALVGRGAHVTKSAVASVLRELKELGELTSADPSKSTVSRARAASASLSTVYRDVLTTRSSIDEHGTSVEYAIIQPIPFLVYSIEAAEPFSKFVQWCLMATPSTHDRPWSIIVYGDEVTPGNPLAYSNPRKVWATYWSFAELGSAALSTEDMWFPMHATRTTEVNTLHGGISIILGDALLLMFGDPHSFENGILLKFHDGSTAMLYAKLTIIVADADALKQFFCIKGYAGNKLCFLCKNVMRHASGLHMHAPPYVASDGRAISFVSTACVDASALDLATNDSVYLTVEPLRAAHTAGETEGQTERSLEWHQLCFVECAL